MSHHTMRRTGLQMAIKRLDQFCKIYVVWLPRMLDAIDNTEGFSDAQKAAAKNALSVINEACHSLVIFKKIYES